MKNGNRGEVETTIQVENESRVSEMISSLEL